MKTKIANAIKSVLFFVIGLVLLPFIFFDDNGTLLSAVIERILPKAANPVALFGVSLTLLGIWILAKGLILFSAVAFLLKSLNPQLTFRQALDKALEAPEKGSAIAEQSK